MTNFLTHLQQSLEPLFGPTTVRVDIPRSTIYLEGVLFEEDGSLRVISRKLAAIFHDLFPRVIIGPHSCTANQFHQRAGFYSIYHRDCRWAFKADETTFVIDALYYFSLHTDFSEAA